MSQSELPEERSTPESRAVICSPRGRVLQILRRDDIRVSQQGVEETNIGAASGVGLGGGGHAELQFPGLDGVQQIAHRYLPAHEAQFLRQALPDAEDDRRDGDGLGVLHPVLGVPGSKP